MTEDLANLIHFVSFACFVSGEAAALKFLPLMRWFKEIVVDETNEICHI